MEGILCSYPIEFHQIQPNQLFDAHLATMSTPHKRSKPTSQDFFSQEPAPKDMPNITAQLQAFLAGASKVVCITSGGTTVPLEQKTVRFLDNFSTGSRGAAMTEQFLKEPGYKVVLLHRAGSKSPFVRHFDGDSFVKGVKSSAAEGYKEKVVGEVTCAVER